MNQSNESSAKQHHINNHKNQNNPQYNNEQKGQNQIDDRNDDIQKQKLIQKQQQMIRDQISIQSLIQDKIPLAMLMDQFVNNQGFYIKIQNLINIYDQYRKVRRDGNCFYRALIFCIFQKIVCQGNKKLQNHMIQKIQKSKQHLLKANFSGLVFQDIKELLVEKLGTKVPKNAQELIKFFRDEESNYIILLLRFITSGQIKNNVLLYQTFIDDQIPVQIFCRQQVQPIDKQADQIQIMALLNYLQIGIRIVYLDSNKNKQPYKVILPESFHQKDIVAQLLYRPDDLVFDLPSCYLIIYMQGDFYYQSAKLELFILLIILLNILQIMGSIVDFFNDLEQFQYGQYCKTGANQYGAVMLLHLGTIAFILGKISNDYSWVDRIWSILPMVFVGHFMFYQTQCLGIQISMRQWVMIGFIIIWGFRLTYNLYRKGGYSRGGEDYRWIYLRKNYPRLMVELLHFFFTSYYQLFLVYWITSPIYYAVNKQMQIFDVILCVLWLIFFIGEVVADRQQYEFQIKKYELLKQKKLENITKPYQYGFIQNGLFKYCRHPNFFCQICMWWVIYFFSVGSYGVNLSGVGVLLLSFLFLGSTALTEHISSQKYPQYKAYQKKVSMLIPWIQIKKQKIN